MNTFETLVEAFNESCQNEQTITYIEGENNESVVTFSQLKQRALQLLGSFQQSGLKQNDELIIFLKNNERFIEVFWACILGGIVPVPVAIGISDEHRSKLFKIFTKLKRAHIYLSQENLQRLQNYASRQDMEFECLALTNKALIHESLSYTDLMVSADIANVSSDDTAFIQFSSGSTSDPKGVILTHRNIVVNINAIKAGSDYRATDCSFSWMPLTHDMGLIGFHINMLVWNIRQCIMATDLFSRRPLLWLQKVSKHKASLLCSPNFGYKHYLKSLGDKEAELELSHVRLIYNGAEPISVDTCKQFLARLEQYGLKRNTMFPVYGLAEATLAVAFPAPASDYRVIHLNRNGLLLGDPVEIVSAEHTDAVSFVIEGEAVQNVELKITRQDNQILPEDQIGDIQIKGPNVTQGYYLNENANATVLTGDGWLNTGDLGFLHNNELVVTGRTKDIIFSNGQNYFPHDLEAIALQNTELELGKVVVTSVTDQKQQQDEVLIFLFFRKDINDFPALARDVAKLINTQTGLVIDAVIPVIRIPKTTSGKVQRRILVDRYLTGVYDAVLCKIGLAPSVEAVNVADSSEATSTLSDLQQQLVDTCNKVLKNSPIQVNDNFFDAGISSLALAEIHEKIDEIYPNLLDVVDFFEHQTVLEIAELISKKLASNT